MSLTLSCRLRWVRVVVRRLARVSNVAWRVVGETACCLKDLSKLC